MKTYCLINQKGGVAKTTSCLNIGAALAAKGKKVLLVDLDAQGSLTKSIGFKAIKEEQPTIYEVLSGKASAKEAILHAEAEQMDLLPSDIRLSGAEIELISVPGRDFLLKEALEPLTGAYDYIFIDCSPSLNILTLMALAAVDGILIPVAAQYMPLDGIKQLLQTIEVVKKRLNPQVKISGVIITLYDARRGLDKSITEAIRERFPSEVFADVIKYNAKIAEAPTFGKSVLIYAPKSTGAEAYIRIAEELMRREET